MTSGSIFGRSVIAAADLLGLVMLVHLPEAEAAKAAGATAQASRAATTPYVVRDYRLNPQP